jgi:hypothetical protein
MEFNSVSYSLPLVGVDQLSVCTGPKLIDRAIAMFVGGGLDIGLRKGI